MVFFSRSVLYTERQKMDLSKENIDILIIRYLSDDICPEERKVLESWVKEQDTNHTYFQQMKNMWEITNPALDPDSISVSQALKQVHKLAGIKSPKEQFFTYWQRIAAILILPLIATFLIILFYTSATQEYKQIVYQEISAPYGSRLHINLPDGSIVYLNSGGKLIFPTIFKAGERNVYLNGEAYFEVESDKSNPFVVHTNAIDVKATGTIFNVEGYDNDTLYAVTMMSGKVQVSIDKKHETIDITKGERVSYNVKKHNYTVEDVDPYKWCAWKDGNLIFRDEPLINVLKKIGQVYNAEIIVQDTALSKHLYRATFKNESLDDILRLIKKTVPLSYIEKGNIRGNDGTFTKRCIIVERLN